jgi:uncharacterized membrane protein
MTILFSGLSAGLFFAWTFTVIPGTRRLPDLAYLQTMQFINRYIRNPVFFLIFFGTALLLPLTTFLLFRAGAMADGGWQAAASGLYLSGVIGVTVFSNVPLNNRLDRVKTEECSLPALQEARSEYEKPWNRSNSIRTFSSILAFSLVIFQYYFLSGAGQDCFR